VLPVDDPSLKSPCQRGAEGLGRAIVQNVPRPCQHGKRPQTWAGMFGGRRPWEREGERGGGKAMFQVFRIQISNESPPALRLDE
jgi:hypothetical protein